MIDTVTMNDCERAQALLPAYAAGMCDQEDARLVEAALTDCPELAGELAEYAALSNALLHTAPDVPLPAALHDRLMAQIASQPASPQIVRRPRPVLMWAGLAAACVLLILSNVLWAVLLSSSNALQQDLRAQNQLLLAAADGRASRIALLTTDGTESATILWMPDQLSALLVTAALPATDRDHNYQLWLINDETIVSAGIFGGDSYLFTPPAPLSTYDTLAISIEPRGGSTAPTTPPIASGVVE
jgi:anti-sigma-K factor RskA